MAWADRLIVTCEHGGNDVPDEHAPLFAARRRLLRSHRAWDPGALHLAQTIAQELGATLHFSTVTRLLIDLNRSLDNPEVFSEITRALPYAQKRALAGEHHRPYRSQVERSVARLIGRSDPPRRVLHVSVHSFTPVLRGHQRTTDIGVLFDPKRPRESRLARRWTEVLRDAAPSLTIDENEPYQGWTDGLTTALRSLFPDELYAGIELEVNQRIPRRGGRAWRQLEAAVVSSLRPLLADVG